MGLFGRFLRWLPRWSQPPGSSTSVALFAEGPAIHFPDDYGAAPSSTNELNWQSSSLYWWGIEKQRSF